MALMFPIVMLVAERLQRRGAVVRRATGSTAAQMQIGALTAFLQLPDADPDVGHDGDLHGDDGAARRGLRRADRRGARHRVLGACRRPTPVTELPGARRAGAARRRLPLPGRRARRCCATSRFRADAGQTTAIIGSTGAGKTTLLVADPAAVRRHRRRGAGRRRRRARARPGAAVARGSGWCRSGRTCSPARSPATCATATRTPPTSELWHGARGRPGPRLRRGDARTGWTRPIAQGGTNVSGGQRQRLAIARALVRRAGDLPVRRLVLRARPRHRRPAARRAAAGHRATPPWSIVAQRVSTIIDADQIIVLDDGAIVGVGTHDELLRDLPDVRRDRRVAARRGGGGMSERPRRSDAGRASAEPRPAAAAGGRPARRAGGPPWMSAGMPAEKSMNFGPSARRLLGRLRPNAAALVGGARARPSSAWRCRVLGPKILGHATDLIFAGVDRQAAARRASPRSRPSRPRARRGNDNFADLLAADATSCPGAGIDFAALGARAAAGARCSTSARRPVRLAAGLPAQRRRAAHRAAGCAPTSRTS